MPRHLPTSGGLLACALLTAALAGAQPRVGITGIRHFTFAETTRVIVEFDGEFQFRADRADNPDRIFFDVPNAEAALFDGRRHGIVAVNDARVLKVRVAQNQPDMVRMVFDLGAGKLDYSTSQLKNPDRLVVELRPAGTKARSESAPVPVDAPSAAPPRTVKPFDPSTLKETRQEPPPTPTLPAPPVLKAGANLPPVKVEGLKAKPPAAPAAAVPKETLNAPPAAARAPERGERSLTRALGLKLQKIVIDPGHGGVDHGTTGPTGLLEKELTLDLALRLGALIEQKLGAQVVYTRTDDSYVPLERRTQIANEEQADLFLSIHANSSPYKTASGVETFYLNFSGSADAMEVAARENASAQKSIHELKSLLEKIALTDKLAESRELAQRVQVSMTAHAQRVNPKAKDRGVKRAPFIVLIGAEMPSVLTEIGFLSNSREESYYRRPENRQKAAEALYKGISAYAGTLSRAELARREE